MKGAWEPPTSLFAYSEGTCGVGASGWYFLEFGEVGPLGPQHAMLDISLEFWLLGVSGDRGLLSSTQEGQLHVLHLPDTAGELSPIDSASLLMLSFCACSS